MRVAVLCAFLLGALASSPASASEGLAWKWDAPRRFQIFADVKLAEWLTFTKSHNVDARVTSFLLGVTASCADTGRGSKRTVEVGCTIEDLQIEAVSTESDQGRLQPILDEIDQKLVGAQVRILHGDDGRVKNYDVDGLDKDWRRENLMAETLRLVLGRAFAALDLQLPRKGDDRGRAWRQTGVLALAVPSAHGSVGQSTVDHQVGKVSGTRVEITSAGRGVVGSGAMIQVAPGGPERPANMYDMTIHSVAVFDTALGTLLERQYLAEGSPTASSLASEGTKGTTYVQAVRLRLIPDGVDAPPLGPNREVLRDETDADEPAAGPPADG